MAGTDNAAVTLASLQISISVEEIHDLGLDRMRKQSMRSMAQDIGELIGECSWLNQFRNGIFRHGISLLQWRSGGVKHPHDMPPYRFTPSPTFCHSSGDRPWKTINRPLPTSLHLADLGTRASSLALSRRCGRATSGRSEPSCSCRDASAISRFST